MNKNQFRKQPGHKSVETFEFLPRSEPKNANIVMF